jgi:hypothetical protein
MKITIALLATLCLLIARTTPAFANELKIELKVDGESTAEIVVKIQGEIAMATVAGEIEQFNLKDGSWLESKTGKWTTLAQCKEWADESKAKSLKSADAAPANVRPFLLWSLDPTFKVEKTDNTLRLTSGQVDYIVEGQASKSGVEEYFGYAVLNAYKKAMTDRKLPPFSELRAIAEMKNLGHIPKRITVTIPGIPKAPKFEMEITETKP